MFTRYWRTYPWYLQLFLFMTMMFTFFWLGTSFIWMLLPKLTGVPTKDFLNITPQSPLRTIRTLLWATGINTATVFILPALLFAYLSHPRPAGYLGLRLPGKSIQWLLVTGIILGFLPLTLSLEGWMHQHINLGQWAKSTQGSTDATFAAFLKMDSIADFIKVFFVLAVLPPLGEELLFRGVLLRFAHKRSRWSLPDISPEGQLVRVENKRPMLFPVLLTSTLFALMHISPYGFVFIFAAGALLACIYWLTGSLWCSIWAHFLFNGIQIILIFLSRQDASLKAAAEGNQFSPYLLVAGLLVFVVCLYGLVKMKTPLPKDWSDDFKGG